MEGITTLVTEPSSPKFVVSPSLLDVLKAEGALGEQFTKREIMNYLRSYICSRFLYDVKNPTLVHCENDILGKALGVKMFAVNEVMKLLSSKVFLAAPLQKGSNGMLSTKLAVLGGVNGVEKRKSSDIEDEPLSKRHCAELLDPKMIPRNSPIYIDIYDAPDYDSSPETVLSVQGYETAAAKDSSDDLWFLETEEEYEVEIEADEFDVEYEVNSLSSKSDHDDVSDSESDVADMEMVGAAILVCQNDSDVEFWADGDSDSAIDENSSSESDPEITDGDKWKCLNCSAYNRPLLRFCQKCWRLRTDWLPDCRRPQRHQRRRRRLRRTNSAPNGATDQGHMSVRHRKTSRSMLDVSIVDEHSSTDLDSNSSNLYTGVTLDGTGESSQEGSQPSTSGVSLNEGSFTNPLASLCSICLTRPKNASIVHGKIGHQTCCYTCGKKLWIRNKPCPICRRTIQKVIQNYIV